MSSSLSLFPALPSQLRTYVSVTTGVEDMSVNTYAVSSLGVWTKSTIAADSVSGGIYADLGKIVFHDPVAYAADDTSSPDVDVRKVRPVRTDGLTLPADSLYVPLGTRVKDTLGATTTAIPACWIGLNASGTIGHS